VRAYPLVGALSFLFNARLSNNYAVKVDDIN